MSNIMKMGLDIGSTTIKIVLMQEDKLIYQQYRRHHADIEGELLRAFADVTQLYPQARVQICVTGSGGLNVAKWLNIPFVQEVIAETEAIRRYNPEADVIIELGGEDAKITYLKPTPEQRMNGSCAGGTGAFIDQMASLLQTDAAGLNELAKRYDTLYPIASRCGVFAKSDLQPLINDGAAKEDLAASVLQAVVSQTIAGLACGRPIRGKVIFLGGPLHFLSELREAYRRALPDSEFIIPESAQLYVAIGAALMAKEREVALKDVMARLREKNTMESELPRMRKLFETEQEKDAFYQRHDRAVVEVEDISVQSGPCFLGLDAGSTTTKAVLLNQDKEIIYTYYAGNQGNPVSSGIQILKDLYAQLPKEAYIAHSCVTGYGENLIRAALGMDSGEIETMAHYKSAEHFCPGVEFIIDIGGQDMKCMQVRDGVINNIRVNEACSSGCGSFIQTFAETLNMSTEEFAKEALLADHPVDLGTRCTVFMNSRVKQAQKEGATVGDISCGLSYSVVRNALYKVIKLKDPDKMGEKVVVQGGTFLNDAILRSFELISGKQVIRPNIAGLMGAFGAGILAQERWQGQPSTLLGKEQLERFSMETERVYCQKCTNHCHMTVSTFQDGKKYTSGNRCERGAGEDIEKNQLPNLFEYKYKRVFAYQPLAENQARRGVIGIPRTLNIYEDYPLWFTILTELGFRVVLSGRSDHRLFERGMESIPSESVCYPAKLAHGHMEDLIARGVRTIFYPDVAYEQQENPNAGNHYNCPIVTSYPEVIKNNMEQLREQNIRFLNPFFALSQPKAMAKTLAKVLDIPLAETVAAVTKGLEEQDKFHLDIKEKGEQALEYIQKHQVKGIVLAGRPYHIDPEIHHGIPEMIKTLGMAVLTEDSVQQPGLLQRPIRVVDQWAYHTRLYEAAAFVTTRDDLELVQLNSFGCGLDAVTTDQVQEILEAKGKIYTTLKIDEVSNLGAARIRMRSLKVAMEERAKRGDRVKKDKDYTLHRAVYTKEMKGKHTVIAPQMSPVHFTLLESMMNGFGYNVVIPEHVSKEDIEVGLKYVNNDACYPTIVVVGQLLNCLVSGKYDPDNTTIAITQTGGGCRATNYVAFLRKALKDAGFSQVPVLSISAQLLEKNPGLQLKPAMLHRAMKAFVLGDLFQTVLLRTRPYEIEQGSANRLYQRWNKIAKEHLEFAGYSRTLGRRIGYYQLIDEIVDAFDQLPLQNIPRKPRVGIVGEILVKFHPDANNNAIGVIESEGCEAVVPSLLDFFLYGFYNSQWKYQNIGTVGKGGELTSKALVAVMERYRNHMKERLSRSGKYLLPVPIQELAESASQILAVGNNTGEGWFLTAEMIELITHGVPNIICAQPFACLPNHVVGKGMIKELRHRYPQSNIVAIDYDPGASEVNQLNRIKLMISAAFLSEKGYQMSGEGKVLDQKNSIVCEPVMER